MTRHHIVDLVETALRDEPHCRACGAPTLVVSDDLGVRLECSSLREHRSLLQRLVVPDVGHTRRQLLEAEDLVAA